MANNRHEVLTLGEPLVLLQPDMPVSIEQATSLNLDLAGAEANLAIGLSRLGHAVRYISRVGDDPFGRRVRAVLETEGVDVTDLKIDSHASTGIYFKEWLPDGQRRIYYYRKGSAASRLTPEDLHAESFAGVRIVHLTGITPALSASCAATVHHACVLAHAAGALVSFDPNYRPQLWSPEEMRSTLLPLLAQVDMLLLSQEDACALFALDEEASILQLVSSAGPEIVVLKQGERGAQAWNNGEHIEVPAVPVERVIDPVGAGDGFNAGFLAGWLRGASFEAALHLGAQVGAAAVAHAGDYAGYPYHV